MRLINIQTLELRSFVKDIPAYAILSHRWGPEEISLQDYEQMSRRTGLDKHGDIPIPTYDEATSPQPSSSQNSRGPHMARDDAEMGRLLPSESRYCLPTAESRGFEKIKSFCHLVHEHNQMKQDDTEDRDELPQWVWVDTCCIDKTSAELSEAINSMFAWYASSKYCIAYLDDVESPASFYSTVQPGKSKSIWFSRGWTLQELLAPDRVEFYASNWQYIGARNAEALNVVANETGIAAKLLKELKRSKNALFSASVAQRMSWAARRVTTRSEDIAYCLMGLFGVNMPLLYGEGKRKAFRRLQQEIISQSDDETIFATPSNQPFQGILASDPIYFASCGNILKCVIYPRPAYTITNKGLDFTSHAVQIEPLEHDSVLGNEPKPDSSRYIVKLNCASPVEGSKGQVESHVIVLVQNGDTFYRHPRSEHEVKELNMKQVAQNWSKRVWKKVESMHFYIALDVDEIDRRGGRRGGAGIATPFALRDGREPWYTGFHGRGHGVVDYFLGGSDGLPTFIETYQQVVEDRLEWALHGTMKAGEWIPMALNTVALGKWAQGHTESHDGHSRAAKVEAGKKLLSMIDQEDRGEDIWDATSPGAEWQYIHEEDS